MVKTITYLQNQEVLNIGHSSELERVLKPRGIILLFYRTTTIFAKLYLTFFFVWNDDNDDELAIIIIIDCPAYALTEVRINRNSKNKY